MGREVNRKTSNKKTEIVATTYSDHAVAWRDCHNRHYLPVDEPGGVIQAITDDKILAGYKLLANKEEILAEPASAISVAGVIKKQSDGAFS
jgi:threonine synthase